jgi:anti-anti-sigma factor
MQRRKKGTDRRRGSSGEAYRDKQLVIWRIARPSGLRLVGEVDAFNVGRVAEILASSLNGQSGRDVHIDLSLLEFVDVSGVRALVSAAEQAAGRHRLILYGLPPLMSRVMDLVGWNDLQTLVIAEKEFPQDGTEPGDRRGRRDEAQVGGDSGPDGVPDTA